MGKNDFKGKAKPVEEGKILGNYPGYNKQKKTALLWRQDFKDEGYLDLANFTTNDTPKKEASYMDINRAYATAKDGKQFCDWIVAAILELKQKCLAQIPEKFREQILNAYNREEDDIPCFYNFTGKMRNEHYY